MLSSRPTLTPPPLAIAMEFIFNWAFPIPAKLQYEFGGRSLINTPNRVVSTFGEGKIVQFACNPEYVINISILFKNLDWQGDPYYGQRSIQNALFYASSEKKEEFNTSFSYPIDLVDYYLFALSEHSNKINDELIYPSNFEALKMIVRETPEEQKRDWDQFKGFLEEKSPNLYKNIKKLGNLGAFILDRMD